MRTSVAAFASIAIGCTAGGSRDVGQGKYTLSEAEASALPLPTCSGQWLQGGVRLFRHIDVRVRPYRCIEDNPLQSATVAWIDEDNRAVDVGELARQDERAFADQHNRMGEELRRRKASLSPDTPIDVDIWFDAPIVTAPALFGVPSLDVGSMEPQRNRLNTAARDLIDALERDVPGATVYGREKWVHDDPVATIDSRIPRLTARIPVASVQWLGHLPGVNRVMYSADALAQEEIAGSEVYYDVIMTPWYQDAFGLDGDGVVVSILEGERPNSTHNLAMPDGACVPSTGPNYDCACPAGTVNAHPRRTTSVVRNTVATLRGGAARNATTISANFSGSAGCSISGSAQWSALRGATVVNRSSYSAGHTAQTSLDMYLDLLPMLWPFPTVSIIAGNNTTDDLLGNLMRNGIVVGAANHEDKINRANIDQMAGYSSWRNPNDPCPGSQKCGWELPHVVAPVGDSGFSTTVAGYSTGTTNESTGTSFAAPQVSGVVAAIQEFVPSLRTNPPANMAIVMASAEHDVLLPRLDLDDNVDDRDGVGLVNGIKATIVAGTQASWPAEYQGWESGVASSGTSSVAIYAKARPGDTIRVASIVMADPNCGANPSCTGTNCTCTSNPFVKTTLVLYDASTFVIQDASSNQMQNYQYALTTNPASTDKLYVLVLYFDDWGGLNDAWWSIAFMSDNLAPL